MKIITLKESDLINIIKSHLNEDFNMGSPSSSNQKGAIEIDKTTNPNPTDLKKYTSQGIDVKLMDEELGEEQTLVLKHKFEPVNDNKIALNIYSSKDKIKLSSVLDYIITIKNQLKVQQAFANNTVELFIKTASSGRYQYMGSITPDVYHKYLNVLKNTKNDSSEPIDDEPNKKIIKI